MRIRTGGLNIVLACSLLAPGFLYAQTPPSGQPPAPMSLPQPVMDIVYKGGNLSVKAENADLVTLLKKIGEAAHISLEISQGVSGKVTATISGVELEEGVSRLLDAADAKNFAAEFKRSDGEEQLHLAKIFVATTGNDRHEGGATEPLPPKKRARLSNGKEIEFFKGQFFMRLGPKDMRQAFSMTREQMLSYVQSRYPLKMVKEYSNGIGPIYLFVATREIDELDLWRKLSNDEVITLVTLNGLGKQSATIPFDDKGRFRYDPELNKQWREIDQRGGLTLEEAKKIWWQMYPYRKLGKFDDTEFPYEEGSVNISFDDDDITDKLLLDEYILSLCNDFNGIPYDALHGGLRSYEMYFPNLKGDDIFQFVKMLRKDPVIKANKGRVGWEGWSSKPMLRQIAYGEFQDPAHDGHYAEQWSLEKIHAPQAWSIWSGLSEVEVAVVDTGIDVSAEGVPHEDFWEYVDGTRSAHHIDLADAKNFMTSPVSGSYGAINDRKGHGTHVSGIIGAIGGNGRGIAGVAGAGGRSGNILLLPLNIYSPDAESMEETSKKALHAGLEYVRAHKVDVLNLSLDAENFQNTVSDIEKIYNNGTVVVIASPDPAQGLPPIGGYAKPDKEYLQDKLSKMGAFTESTPGIESFLSKILYVSATGPTDAPIRYNVAGDAVTVSAPGADIVSLKSALTDFLGNWGAKECNPTDPQYVLATGTSMAAPHVSGLAALVLSMSGTQENAYTATVAGADPISAIGMGTGRINMFNTLDRVRSDHIAPMAPANLVGYVDGNRKNALSWDPPADDGDGNPLLDLYRYKIYRGKYPNFPIARQFFLCYSDGTDASFVDTTVKDNAEYYYRVTAVDLAGNESAPTESWSFATDYVLMFSRSSRWMLGSNPSASYFNAVGLLAGALAEMMPDDSRVGVLVFRDQVYSSEPALKPVSEAGLRGFSSGDYAMSALKLPGVGPEQWRKDYWYLDFNEVLLGGNGDEPWRDSALSSRGEAAANAVTLLAGEDGRNKVGILITDWYDNSLIGSANYANQQRVYDRWLTTIRDAEKNFDLKNIVLFGPGNKLPYPRDERYFAQGLQIAKAGEFFNALGEEDVSFSCGMGAARMRPKSCDGFCTAGNPSPTWSCSCSRESASGSRCRSTPR